MRHTRHAAAPGPFRDDRVPFPGVSAGERAVCRQDGASWEGSPTLRRADRNDPVTGAPRPCRDRSSGPPGHLPFPLPAASPAAVMGLRSRRVTMGATLGWPALAVLGFLVLTGVVVVLGTSSTARYEFE